MSANKAKSIFDGRTSYMRGQRQTRDELLTQIVNNMRQRPESRWQMGELVSTPVGLLPVVRMWHEWGRGKGWQYAFRQPDCRFEDRYYEHTLLSFQVQPNQEDVMQTVEDLQGLLAAQVDLNNHLVDKVRTLGIAFDTTTEKAKTVAESLAEREADLAAIAEALGAVEEDNLLSVAKQVIAQRNEFMSKAIKGASAAATGVRPVMPFMQYHTKEFTFGDLATLDAYAGDMSEKGWLLAERHCWGGSIILFFESEVGVGKFIDDMDEDKAPVIVTETKTDVSNDVVQTMTNDTLNVISKDAVDNQTEIAPEEELDKITF